MKKIVCKIFCAVLLITISSWSQELQEIRVHLPTSSPLHPIYVSKIQAQQTLFDVAYLLELEAVLQRDLNYNGATKVSAKSTEKEQLLEKPSLTAFNPSTWNSFGVPYALKWEIAQKTVRATLFNAHTGSIKTFADIALTGNINQDRKTIHKLTDSIHKALFNSDGIAYSRILFAYQVKNAHPDGKEWVSEIWECDWDGANLRQVTHDESYCVSPVLLPPHSHYANDHFLYVSYRQGHPKIFIASLQDGEGKRLIDLKGNQLLPAVSSQRDKVAFICDAAGRTDLFVQPLHPKTNDMGKPAQLYSHPRSTQASPTFSPDGSKIAFVSDKDGGTRIFVIPTVQSDKRSATTMITKKNRENSCPAWSPDGKKLAYSATTNGIRQIWIYDFGTAEEWQLTSGSGNKENPAWAPNSRHIIFNSTDDNCSELYIVNLNQPEAMRISRGSGKKHYPTWGVR